MIDEIKNLNFNDLDRLNNHKRIVKHLLKKHDDLEKDEVIYLIIFFTKLKIKECGLDIQYEFLEDQNNDKTIAFYNDKLKKICYYTNMIVDKSIKCGKNLKIRTYGIVSNLNTINHEFEHAIQHDFYKKEKMEDIVKINPLIFFMAFEDITNKYAKKFHQETENKVVNKSNYQYNYENMLFEQDANYAGIKNTEKWLMEYCSELADEFMFTNSKTFNNLTTNRNHLDFITQKSLTINEEEMSIYKINLITTYAIKKDINILNEYPILKLAYNLDGTKKNYKQLSEERLINLEKVSGKEKINLGAIYDTLIKIDPIITIEKLEEELFLAIKNKNEKLINKTIRKIIDISSELNKEYYQLFKLNINNELEKAYKEIKLNKKDILFFNEYIKIIRNIYDKTLIYNLGFDNKRSIELKEKEIYNHQNKIIEEIENMCGFKIELEKGFIVGNDINSVPEINLKNIHELMVEQRKIEFILSSKVASKKVSKDEYDEMKKIISLRYQEMIELVKRIEKNKIGTSDMSVGQMKK